jgi:hypothetical protein
MEYHKESGTWAPQGDEIRGEIQWDPETNPGDQSPLIVVDGKELTWLEFGRTVLTHEGFHFVLKFVDPTAALDAPES